MHACVWLLKIYETSIISKVYIFFRDSLFIGNQYFILERNIYKRGKKEPRGFAILHVRKSKFSDILLGFRRKQATKWEMSLDEMASSHVTHQRDGCLVYSVYSKYPCHHIFYCVLSSYHEFIL